ncbi:MAG: D-mannonate epimerase [Planctomycetes bacterium RBG_16_64_10]|nr:MAG: D-mannonate epimerase [Planctomycetes bacterium RBG_16_64_10]
MLIYEQGTADTVLTDDDLRAGLYAALDQLGPRRRVLLVPPDITRLHSRAGVLSCYAWQYYGDRLTDVLPALGTHVAMTEAEIGAMFGPMPSDRFRVHDWRRDVMTLGTVPADYVREVSGGAVDYAWPVQLNRLLVEGGFDLILSIGQVVPHEVVGMANHNKNILIGTGGPDSINKSHFLGAAYGMERIMGRVDTPVRRVLNYAATHFAQHLPIVYVLTVVGRDDQLALQTRGLFVGDGTECFVRAAALSAKVNFQVVTEPFERVVVFLDPAEYKSTWLGNKSIYRTRMALADGGELIVLAPGLKQFGEDPQIDAVIRRYGYQGTPAILAAVERDEDLQNNLSGAAHLIHGSSEGRFRITYCPGHLSRAEVEAVHFQYADLATMAARYDPAVLRDGYNTMADGQQVFYISNPALGLWAAQQRLDHS